MALQAVLPATLAVHSEFVIKVWMYQAQLSTNLIPNTAIG